MGNELSCCEPTPQGGFKNAPIVNKAFSKQRLQTGGEARLPDAEAEAWHARRDPVTNWGAKGVPANFDAQPGPDRWGVAPAASFDAAGAYETHRRGTYNVSANYSSQRSDYSTSRVSRAARGDILASFDAKFEDAVADSKTSFEAARPVMTQRTSYISSNMPYDGEATPLVASADGNYGVQPGPMPQRHHPQFPPHKPPVLNTAAPRYRDGDVC